MAKRNQRFRIKSYKIRLARGGIKTEYAVIDSLTNKYVITYSSRQEAVDSANRRNKEISNPAIGKWIPAKAIKFLGGEKIQVKV